MIGEPLQATALILLDHVLTGIVGMFIALVVLLRAAIESRGHSRIESRLSNRQHTSAISQPCVDLLVTTYTRVQIDSEVRGREKRNGISLTPTEAEVDF